MAECDKFLCGKESFLVTLPFKVTNKNPYLTKKGRNFVKKMLKTKTFVVVAIQNCSRL